MKLFEIDLVYKFNFIVRLLHEAHFQFKGNEIRSFEVYAIKGY